VRGTGRRGVVTVAWPMIDAVGQLAGLVSKTLARQAFWRVERREGRALGRSTLVLAMFVSVPWGVLG